MCSRSSESNSNSGETSCRAPSGGHLHLAAEDHPPGAGEGAHQVGLVEPDGVAEPGLVLQDGLGDGQPVGLPAAPGLHLPHRAEDGGLGAGGEVGHGRHAPPVEVPPGEVVEQVAHAVDAQAPQGRHRPRAAPGRSPTGDCRGPPRPPGPAPALSLAPPPSPGAGDRRLSGRGVPFGAHQAAGAGASAEGAAGGDGASRRRRRRETISWRAAGGSLAVVDQLPAGGGQPGLRRRPAPPGAAERTKRSRPPTAARSRQPVRCSCRSTLRTRSRTASAWAAPVCGLAAIRSSVQVAARAASLSTGECDGRAQGLPAVDDRWLVRPPGGARGDPQGVWSSAQTCSQALDRSFCKSRRPRSHSWSRPAPGAPRERLSTSNSWSQPGTQDA